MDTMSLIYITDMAFIVLFAFLIYRLVQRSADRSSLLFSLMLVANAVWLVLGIMLLPVTSSLSLRTRNNTLLTASLVIVSTQLVFAWLHATVEPIQYRRVITNIAVTMFSFRIWLYIFQLSSPTVSILQYQESNGYVALKAAGAYVPLAFLGDVLFGVTVIFALLIYSSYPDTLADSKEKRNYWIGFGLLILGAVASSITVAVSSFLNATDSHLFLLLNAISDRYLVSLGFAIITVSMSKSPIHMIGVKGDMKSLVERGFIGFVVSAMTDRGPETRLVSPSFVERFEITENMLQLFAMNTVSVVGVGDSFHETLAVLPVPKASAIMSYNYTFEIVDETYTDPRSSNIAPTVFSLLLRKEFQRFIRDPTSAVDIIRQYREKHP